MLQKISILHHLIVIFLISHLSIHHNHPQQRIIQPSSPLNLKHLRTSSPAVTPLRCRAIPSRVPLKATPRYSATTRFNLPLIQPFTYYLSLFTFFLHVHFPLLTISINNAGIISSGPWLNAIRNFLPIVKSLTLILTNDFN